MQPRLDDRHAVLVLAGAFCILYAYFFQGGGWNQNSHFDTVRSIVERHAFDITPYAGNTGDTARWSGKVYANKGPGLALLGTPIYFVLYQIERLSGFEPGAPATATFNAHVLSFFVSGLPAITLVLLLYFHFRRSGGTLRESFSLAAAFGAGSLLLPYSGVVMSHAFTACTLFGSWFLLTSPRSKWSSVLAGLLAGTAVLTDLLALPIAALLLLYAVRGHSERPWRAFGAGAGAVALVLVIYDIGCFGAPFITNQTIPAPQFQTQGLWLGMLGVPDLRRLYWLTIHPFRGLFYCCPLFVIPVLSWPNQWRWRELTWEQSIPLAIIAWFALFMLSFNGWTGGFGVGPRYLIPMLPFLFSFALAGFRRCRWPSAILIAASSIFMLSVAAVRVIVRSPDRGTAPNHDPVGDSLYGVISGKISTSTQGVLDYLATENSPWASYNLGELVGLHGTASVVPAFLVLLGLASVAAALPSTPHEVTPATRNPLVRSNSATSAARSP
jgi:hypothetical protein